MRKILLVSVLLVFILIVIFTILTFSVRIKMDDSIDLGNKYRYIQDYPRVIIYHNTDKYKGTGNEITSPIILEYNFNEEFIVAKTRDLETKDAIFWIINKMEQKTEKFLDSLEFCTILKERNINLTLKPINN